MRSILAYQVGWWWNVPMHLYSLWGVRCFGKSTALKMCPPNDSQDCNWGFLSFHKKALCWGTDVLADLEEIGCGLVENKNQIKGLLVLQWDLQGQPSQILCSMGQYQANSYLSPISWSLRPYKQNCYKTDLLYKQICFITRFFFPCNLQTDQFR